MNGTFNRIRALLIEDNPGDARLIREMLREAGAGQGAVDLRHVERLATGLEQLRGDETDALMADLNAAIEAEEAAGGSAA